MVVVAESKANVWFRDERWQEELRCRTAFEGDDQVLIPLGCCMGVLLMMLPQAKQEVRRHAWYVVFGEHGRIACYDVVRRYAH